MSGSNCILLHMQRNKKMTDEILKTATINMLKDIKENMSIMRRKMKHMQKNQMDF